MKMIEYADDSHVELSASLFRRERAIDLYHELQDMLFMSDSVEKTNDLISQDYHNRVTSVK